MDKYRLELKIKNNLLWQQMSDFGFDSILKLSKATGIGSGTLYKFLNLQNPPLNEAGETKPSAQALCDFFGVSVDELFPEEVLFEGLKKHRFIGTADAPKLLGIGQPSQLALEDNLLRQSMNDGVSKLMECLEEREIEILKMRFGLGFKDALTLDECGKVLDISGARVRELEARALRKLRNPKNACKLFDTDLHGYSWKDAYDAVAQVLM